MLHVALVRGVRWHHHTAKSQHVLASVQVCLGDPNGSTFILGIYMLQFAPGIVSQSLEACGGGCCDVVLRWLCLC